MTMSRFSGAAAAAALLTAVLVGCGDADPAASETDPTGTGEDVRQTFVEEANALCTEVNENINAIFADLAGPPGPDAFGELAVFGRSFVDDLRALEPPGDAEATIDDAIATYEEALDAFEQASTATDAATGMAAADEAGALVQQADATLAEYGIDACQATSGAGGQPPDDVTADPGAVQVPVTMDEYSFEVASTLTPGPTAFTLDNVGAEPHEMVLIKLIDGATVEDALAAEMAGEDPQQFFAGPPVVGAAGPGEQTVVNADLTPGTYALVCFIPTPEGTPHVAEGMVASIEVTG